MADDDWAKAVDEQEKKLTEKVNLGPDQIFSLHHLVFTSDKRLSSVLLNIVHVKSPRLS